jgi:hypothetical protein
LLFSLGKVGFGGSYLLNILHLSLLFLFFDIQITTLELILEGVLLRPMTSFRVNDHANEESSFSRFQFTSSGTSPRQVHVASGIREPSTGLGSTISAETMWTGPVSVYDDLYESTNFRQVIRNRTSA